MYLGQTFVSNFHQKYERLPEPTVSTTMDIIWNRLKYKLSLFIGFTTYMLMPTAFYWCKMDRVDKTTDTLEWI